MNPKIEARIMKISTRKITWMSVSCVVAMLAGMPAIADDTELLLINPDPSKNPKPNVMFILDTSGSMTTTQVTTAPYDGNMVYGGACDTSRIYWTDVDVEPVCNAANLNYIQKTAFKCDFASKQIFGIGSFTNTMVQYRDGGKDGMSSGPARWQYLAAGYNTAPVECQADSGKHGDGRPTFLWAANGTDLADPFTDNPNNELSWGSAPRNLSYTFYDGNYLNWKNSPTTVTMSRINIIKEVTKKVLSSVNNLNVGLMRFNDRDGGPVILGMTDLDSNRTVVTNAVDSLTANGRTPLSETLYENALYWRGMTAHYPNLGLAGLVPTNPNALVSSSPQVYKQPGWDVCAKNYNVVLTDGAPVDDYDPPGLVDSLPNYATAVGHTGCDGPVLAEGGECLDDIAEYLSVEDVDPLTDGDQLVITNTIGFTVGLPILEETALNSGGNYFLADDVESLTRTLLSIIANINDRSLSFSAPAVSVNTFNRTQNLNDLYITTFGAKSRVHWPGNLKKYRIQDSSIVDVNGVDAVDPATGFFMSTARSYWTTGGADGNNVQLGGAAQQLPDPTLRNLYTNNSGSDLTAATNLVAVSNVASFLNSDFGLTGAIGEPTMLELIRWARGEDLLDEDNNAATLVRKAMGDPLHSQPAAVVYGGTAASPDVVIFTATNDGYLHATNGANGQELWAFIPKQLLSNLTRLYFDPRSRYKQYGLDGNVVSVIKDVDRDGVVEQADGDFVQLIFGMRRGGSTFFSLDVTNKTQPKLLWTATLPEFGESWSTPVVARMDINSVAQNADKAVVVIGGGYDTVHDTASYSATPDGSGAGVHILDLKTGARLWRAGPDNGANLQLAKMTRAIPNQLRVVDLSGDGFADRMYASDLGGQVWRFDITNGNAPSTLVAGGVIARLGAEGIATPTAAETRRFYNAPDIALITDARQQRRFIAVNIGSGYRAHPFDLSAADRFFSIRDGDVFNKLTQTAYDNYSIVTDADLVEVSGQTQTVITSSDRGWKFTLPDNEKILATSLTFADQIFFVAFTPDTNAAVTCAAGQGTNYLYRMSAVNGDPIVPNIDTLDPTIADDERRTTLQQGGIAPTPTILFPSPDPNCTGDDCDQPPLGCVGVECFDPGFENIPVRTLWTQDGIQ
jgi:type IV pilus assembly protein PilY1